jgi:hypothetical protein
MPTYSLTTGSTANAFRPLAQYVAQKTNVITMATTDLDLNDTFDICRLPKGARVLDIILSATDMDTNGTPTLVIDVGDSGDTDRFIDGATVGQGAGTIRAGNVAGSAATLAAHTAYTAETLIYGTIATAAATAAAGTITVTVLYAVEF